MAKRAVALTASTGRLLPSAGGATVCDYAKGERMFAQGDQGDAVFFLQRGLVKISALSPNGKGAVLGVLSAGVFFGETCLAERRPARNATATALVDSTISRWELTGFRHLLQKDPDFAAMVVSSLAARASRVEEDLIDHILNSSEKRLARLLMLFANVDRDGAAVRVSQEVLAEMVGTTRSRVCYFMNKFRRLGHISYSDQLVVHPSLRSIVDGNGPHPWGASGADPAS